MSRFFWWLISLVTRLSRFAAEPKYGADALSKMRSTYAFPLAGGGSIVLKNVVWQKVHDDDGEYDEIVSAEFDSLVLP